MKPWKTYQNPLAVWLALFLTAMVSQTASGQSSPQSHEYPHNHLSWFTIETDHFMVHYQEGNRESARETASFAENIHAPITELYNYHPERKVSIVLRDREDFSNGAAFFFDNKIEIWIPPLDTPLRGTHHWLQNVVTHEFTHMVQLGASMKRSKHIPAIYFQWLSYEDVRRPDVLYGFPKGIVTLPFATVTIPAWFAEGTAQYQRPGMALDYWDSHRDMLLRTRILTDTYLDFTEMGVFTSKNSLERELVYNQGFGFTIYLVKEFGEQVLADITRAASEGNSGDFSRVIQSVTGTSGEELFERWIHEKREQYLETAGYIDEMQTRLAEEDGFFNFYPQFSPDDSRFAYLSNRGRDYARTVLVLVEGDRVTEVDELNGSGVLNPENAYLTEHGFSSNAALDFISSRFSFSGRGDQIAYSRVKKNRYGESYNDLYTYHINERKSRQITCDARVQDPAWSPDDRHIAAVQLQQGTQNLVLITPEDGRIKQITGFNNGETLFTPVWHPDGDEIYVAAAGYSSRNLYRINTENREPVPVFADRFIDYRDPWIDSSGEYLYFSSDQTGIFNIYRLNLHTDEIQMLTDVLGGAFMPYVNGDRLYMAEYRADGYKITTAPLAPVSNNFHEKPELIRKPAGINATLFPETPGAAEEKPDIVYEEKPYSETSTGLSVFPVVRFDNYSKLHGGNGTLLRSGKFGLLTENLWRDLKLGAYLSSRDVTENFSLFGGALFGFGSRPADGVADFFNPTRLNNLDRDLFLVAEHRGLPFIERSWSPTVSVELYNLKRNVKNGIEFEEFRCTSCLPETRRIDTRYTIWEASLFLRSKLNRWSLLELGASWSPYSVSSDGFYSEEYREFIPGSTSEYFRGATISAGYHVELIEPTRHADIAPEGIKTSLTYRYQPGRLLDRFELEDGVLSPIYIQEKNHSLEWSVRYGLGLGSKSAGLITSRTFAYLNNPDNYFYLDYTGGMIGLRSYPFFAVGGQRTAFARASFITPIFQRINRQVGSYTLDKLYAHLYLETGNGWGGPLHIGNNLKSGLGAELRFAFNNAYLFPMKFFLNTTYGFDRFEVSLPSRFITTDTGNGTIYGRELLFYFGLTFDFDLL